MPASCTSESTHPTEQTEGKLQHKVLHYKHITASHSASCYTASCGSTAKEKPPVPQNTDSILCQASSSMIDGEAKAWHVPFNDAEEAKAPRRKAEERENNQGQEHLKNAAATCQSLSFKAPRLHPSSTQLKSQIRYKSTNPRSFGPHGVQGRSSQFS